jgi:hypothetical protein
MSEFNRQTAALENNLLVLLSLAKITICLEISQMKVRLILARHNCRVRF